MATWKFILCRSTDFLSLGELKRARNKQITLDLNRPGSLSFDYALTAPRADQIVPVNTCIRAYRNGECVWSGPVWNITENLINETMSVNCVGWFEILYHRLVQPSQDPSTYTTTDAGTIAQNLLGLANATGTTPTGASSSTFITSGSSQTSVNRTRTYNAFQNIGQEIQALSDIENGFDFEVDPNTRKLNVFYPTLGSARANVRLGAGDVVTRSLSSVTRSIDASKMANRVWVVGALDKGNAEDTTSQGKYIMLEDHVQLNDVADSTILAAYANAEVAVRGYPIVLASFDILPGSRNQLFDSFEIGDTIYISAKRGRMKITNQASRVFGASISIDDNGIERLSSIKTRWQGS